MRAILVRVAVDHSYGAWNAPVDPKSREFVFVPIPEKDGTQFLSGLARGYDEVMPSLREFCRRFSCHLHTDLRFPKELRKRQMHLDPDFQHLTYGDRGDRRGAGIGKLKKDDLLVFYSGLRPIRPTKDKLHLRSSWPLRCTRRYVGAKSTQRSQASQCSYKEDEDRGAGYCSNSQTSGLGPSGTMHSDW